MPSHWRPYTGKLIAGWTWNGGNAVQMLVDVSPYTHHGSEDLRWIPLDGVAPGTAAVYPLKGRVPGLGRGQFKLEEVKAFRAAAWFLDIDRDLPADLRGGYEKAVKQAMQNGDPVIDCSQAGTGRGDTELSLW